MRFTSILGALVCAVITCQAGDGEAWQKLLDEAKVSMGDAIETGFEEAGEGVVFHAELEAEGKNVQYSIDVAQGKRTVNVIVDARKGGILEKDVENEDASEEAEAAEIDLLTVVQATEEATEGRVVDAEIVLEKDRPVVRVTYLHDGEVEVVRVDGANGELLDVGERRPPKAKEAAKDKGSDKGKDSGKDEFADRFTVAEDEWASKGRNPWFILEPGYVLVLEGEEDGETARLTITVLDETEEVDGVETRVVEEREEEDGEIVEISRNFFAISKRTNDVYYFGEEVDIYQDGKVVKHEGAWRAGEKKARYGLLMPGSPIVGARYYQEIAPGVAMDRARVVSLEAEVETPEGTFENCLETEESSALESGKERKYYAPGIGLVREEHLRLVKHGKR